MHKPIKIDIAAANKIDPSALVSLNPVVQAMHGRGLGVPKSPSPPRAAGKVSARSRWKPAKPSPAPTASASSPSIHRTSTKAVTPFLNASTTARSAPTSGKPYKRMNQKYWDDLAENFNERVFEIADNELNQALATTIKKLGKQYRTAGDFACGAGGTTTALAAHFEQVIAVDYAAKLLQQARKRVKGDNIRFVEVDLTKNKSTTIKVDVGFCINALIHPVAKKRKRIAATVFRSLNQGGKAVFIAPSLESYLRTYQVLAEYLVSAGKNRKKTVRKVSATAQKEIFSLVEGIADVGTVATKHYLHDEFAQLLEEVGFQVESVDRVEFPWAEVLDNAPEKLGKPYPWDWMVTASR